MIIGALQRLAHQGTPHHVSTPAGGNRALLWTFTQTGHQPCFSRLLMLTVTMEGAIFESCRGFLMGFKIMPQSENLKQPLFHLSSGSDLCFFSQKSLSWFICSLWSILIGQSPEHRLEISLRCTDYRYL